MLQPAEVPGNADDFFNIGGGKGILQFQHAGFLITAADVQIFLQGGNMQIRPLLGAVLAGENQAAQGIEGAAIDLQIVHRHPGGMVIGHAHGSVRPE